MAVRNPMLHAPLPTAFLPPISASLPPPAMPPKHHHCRAMKLIGVRAKHCTGIPPPSPTSPQPANPHRIPTLHLRETQLPPAPSLPPSNFHHSTPNRSLRAGASRALRQGSACRPRCSPPTAGGLSLISPRSTRLSPFTTRPAHHMNTHTHCAHYYMHSPTLSRALSPTHTHPRASAHTHTNRSARHGRAERTTTTHSHHAPPPSTPIASHTTHGAPLNTCQTQITLNNLPNTPQRSPHNV